MKQSEEYVKLYQTKTPNSLIPHLDFIQEIEVKKTAQGYVWDSNGKHRLFLPEDKDGIVIPRIVPISNGRKLLVSALLPSVTCMRRSWNLGNRYSNR